MNMDVQPMIDRAQHVNQAVLMGWSDFENLRVMALVGASKNQNITALAEMTTMPEFRLFNMTTKQILEMMNEHAALKRAAVLFTAAAEQAKKEGAP